MFQPNLQVMFWINFNDVVSTYLYRSYEGAYTELKKEYPQIKR